MTVRNYARLSGSLVVNVEVHDDAGTLDPALILVDGLSPQPGIGWTFANNTWTPPAPDPTVVNQQTIQQRASVAIATLEQSVANWGSLTAAQKDTVAKLTAAMCARLARMTLGQFDSAGQ